MPNTICAHYIVEKLDEISKKIEEDIKMNPDVDVFCDVGVEDLRWEIVHNMGVNAHAAWLLAFRQYNVTEPWKEENNA